MSDGELSRDLGLYSAVTLSMGAMIGGGIFVLLQSDTRRQDLQSSLPTC